MAGVDEVVNSEKKIIVSFVCQEMLVLKKRTCWKLWRADVVIVEIGRAMDRLDIMSALRGFGREKGESTDCESARLRTFQESQAKNGVGWGFKSTLQATIEDW